MAKKPGKGDKVSHHFVVKNQSTGQTRYHTSTYHLSALDYCHNLCIQRQMLVAHTLFLALPAFFIEYCHKLCILRQMAVDESMSVTFCMESTEKRTLLFPLHTNSSLHFFS